MSRKILPTQINSNEVYSLSKAIIAARERVIVATNQNSQWRKDMHDPRYISGTLLDAKAALRKAESALIDFCVGEAL